jgi:hypothetical protein
MPNFVKVDSKPFHSDTYIGPEQEDEEAQPAETLREKSMIIKLNVENTVRWRWVKDQSGADVSFGSVVGRAFHLKFDLSRNESQTVG